ncbi:hypothetical protein PK28_15440 [Hymenobacter sp. DG25B]|uniref:DUF4331 family protein n=1 Tax=Hymenobacter sp. DG25B TaxID=1385664 RepID=UPI000540FF01|nr:DUF4331 family protein [Hymenobacter sp. DG25B]AIZ64713.1 hypothetical protein PK28_15440 [Hymenobacter sp. DG25B]
MATGALGLAVWSGQTTTLEASSHREAPLIADDPLADNTDLYAFRSPNAPETVTIIANYIPLELPQGGPNYNTFGENVRYEIHIKNKTTTTGDDITYRFTFTRENEDPTTFFNIRLGKQNLKTTYKCEMSTGGAAFTTLVANGKVPPTNIGPRSIEDATVGLGTTYDKLMSDAIEEVSGMKIFCGPVDDPFFADLGGIFDLGGIRSAAGARDGLARKNTHAIVLQIPIATLQKDGKAVGSAKNILDADYVIGVWASASRPKLRTLNADGTQTHSGDWVQVSRLGMPLTNEVIEPIGQKDHWNALTPYTEDKATEENLVNPELALYMDDSKFGGAVPGLKSLRIQTASLQSFDFRNTKDGVSALLGNAATAGTAFAKSADGGFGEYLLRAGKPRSVDILPIFHTGVPNLPPYQLATGKPARSPLSAGKPFINNFLPNTGANTTGGDMLRLNMAVPATARNSADFSSEGLLAAAVLGLTDARYNKDASLQAIPNMDGFPNGRRLEDDVVRIELQAVGGIALAAIGLFYDDYSATATNPVTQDLLNVLTFTTGVEKNDAEFKTVYPYVQTPWRGTSVGSDIITANAAPGSSGLNMQAPLMALSQNYPNPFGGKTTFLYKVTVKAPVTLYISDLTGKRVATLLQEEVRKPGTYELKWDASSLKKGLYIATMSSGGEVIQSVKLLHTR